MESRRKFLKATSFGLSYVALRPAAAMALNTQTAAPAKPIVISTWDFGIAANQAAWKILATGGRSLDAVEAGARIPEADLNNHSVGRAGDDTVTD